MRHAGETPLTICMTTLKYSFTAKTEEARRKLGRWSSNSCAWAVIATESLLPSHLPLWKPGRRELFLASSGCGCVVCVLESVRRRRICMACGAMSCGLGVLGVPVRSKFVHLHARRSVLTNDR